MSWVGGASEPGGAKCGRSPNQGPPDLSMGRVSAAGPSPGPLPSVRADAEGRGGCPRWEGRQNRVVPNAPGAPTKGPPTFPWVV